MDLCLECGYLEIAERRRDLEQLRLRTRELEARLKPQKSDAAGATCPGWFRDVACGKPSVPGSKWCESCLAVREKRRPVAPQKSLREERKEVTTHALAVTGVVLAVLAVFAGLVGCSVAVFGGDEDPARDEGPSYTQEQCEVLRVTMLFDKTYSESERNDAAAEYASYCQ